MKILGLGNDIVEISRVEKALERRGFKERVFTQKEIETIEKKGNKAESFAGRFSGKEAVAKALGTGVRGFNLTDIEILNDELGKPYVKLHNSLATKEEKIEIHLSISHSREYATATAIIVAKE